MQPLHTFFLKNSTQPNDGNEILTGLRLMLDPSVKLYLLPSNNAIMIKGLPEEVETAAAVISELDRPRKAFRLTYTLTEMEGGKRLGARHFVLVALDGQRTTLKAGSKIPVVTGKFDVSSAISETQMTYLDVGFNFDATLNALAGGATIKSRVERSSVAEDKPVPGSPADPTVHQAVLEGVTSLALGKTTLLGSLDVPDSTRTFEIEVMLEQAP